MQTTILLCSGDHFDFTAPRADVLDIEVIAHALGNLCRFTGHTRRFYSVAQHSVLVSRLVPPHLALAGLLHDATEALVGDVSSPLKARLPAYRAVEDGIWFLLSQRYGLPLKLPPEVKQADLVALATERRDLMPRERQFAPGAWACIADVTPDPRPIVPLDPDRAARAFLERYHTLTRPRRSATSLLPLLTETCHV